MKHFSVFQALLLFPAAALSSTSATVDHTFNSNLSTDSYFDVTTKIPGTFPRGSSSNYIIDLDWIMKGSLRQRIRGALTFFFRGGLTRLIKTSYALYGRKTPAIVYDARKLEKESGLSKADFFDKYGFVLVDHKSAMTAEDWLESDRNLNQLLGSVDNATKYGEIMDDFRNGDTPVKRIYAKEVEELIRSVVIPRASDVMPPARGIRRRITMNLNKAPAKQIHNDYGLDFDAVVDRNPFFDFDKQRQKYEGTNSSEYMLINLWRPIKPMSTTAPLRSLPLCFLDSTTLSPDDFVTVDTKSLGVVTGLKENPAHKFYYFPDMTVDEVVVFKQFHAVRDGEASPNTMPVFHTAFEDPRADGTTEGRVSFEYRVGLLA